MYYPYLADWLRVFPMEQVMVIRYEDYVATPSEVINDVCKFLGISELFIVLHTGGATGMATMTTALFGVLWPLTALATFCTTYCLHNLQYLTQPCISTLDF